MAKFADAFAQLGVPYSFTIATVNYNVQSQYGAQHVVKVLYQGVELDWWLKPQRFDELFPAGLDAGDKIKVSKNKSPNDPSRTYYAIESVGVGPRVPGQTEQQPAPVLSDRTDMPLQNDASVPTNEDSKWERKDNRVLICAYVKSLIESGVTDVLAIKRDARDLAEWTNKSAGELTAAEMVSDVF